jgi:hypothetical protein
MRNRSIYQALIALSIVSAWSVGGVGMAAIFNENLSTGPGADPAATNVVDASSGFKSGCFLQGPNGGVVQLAPDAAWSRKDVAGDGLNSFSPGHVSHPAGASLPDRIMAGLDSPLVVRAKGLGPVAREARPNPVRLSGILPKLAAAFCCAWFGLCFLRCLYPGNGLSKQRTPRGFFKTGR